MANPFEAGCIKLSRDRETERASLLRLSGRPRQEHSRRVPTLLSGMRVVSGDRSNEMGKSSTSFAFTPIPPARGNFRPPIMSALAGLWRGHMLAAGEDV